MEKSTVKKLHLAVNKVLETVAKEHGFVYKSKNMSYSDCEVSGRMVFVVEGKQVEMMQNTEMYAPLGCAYKVGDPIDIQRKTYEIKEFTKRGCAIIIDINTGKEYRLTAKVILRMSLEKISEKRSKT